MSQGFYSREVRSNVAEDRVTETILKHRIEVTSKTALDVEDFDSLETTIDVKNLSFFYGKHQALFDNNLEIKKNRVTAIIGPSGCGKSTHLRAYNRIYSLYRSQKATGEIWFDGENILFCYLWLQ